MFVKTKERAGRTVYYLCIDVSGGDGERGWKSIEYTACLGETLELSAAQWTEILRKSPQFRSASLASILEAVEDYAARRGLDSEILAGLREAARARRQKTRRGTRVERRAEGDERIAALRMLGLPAGSSEKEIERAFRKAARKHHPDVGGDAAKFRAILQARNLLLGREAGYGETA